MYVPTFQVFIRNLQGKIISRIVIDISHDIAATFADALSGASHPFSHTRTNLTCRW